MAHDCSPQSELGEVMGDVSAVAVEWEQMKVVVKVKAVDGLDLREGLHAGS